MVVSMVTSLEFLIVAMEQNLDFHITNPNMHDFHIVLILFFVEIIFMFDVCL